MSDSGQEHPTNGDDGLFVSPAGFQSAVSFFAFRKLVGLDNSVGPRDAGRFHFTAAPVVAWTATRPENQMLCGREHGHIRTDFGKDGNSCHRIIGEAGSSSNQAGLDGVRFSQTEDLHIFMRGCAIQPRH